MKEILKHKKLKRTFLFSIGIVLLSILILRFLVLPSYEPKPLPNIPFTNSIKDPAWLTIVSRLLDSLFVSLLVTISIALYLDYIEIPENEKKYDIIEPFQIQEIFERERMHTSSWYFSGGTGRYTRAVTIPELSKIAKKSNKHITLKLQVIDPEDKTICQKYASYRSALRSSEKNDTKWTAEYVRQEVLSTIVSAYVFQSINPFLQISIAVKNSFSTMRIDISESSAIITKEDPKEPALICVKDTFLFRTYVEEIHQTFKEFRQINIPTQFVGGIQELTPEKIETILNDLPITDLTTDECQQVCETLKKNLNPYG